MAKKWSEMGAEDLGGGGGRRQRHESAAQRQTFRTSVLAVNMLMLLLFAYYTLESLHKYSQKEVVRERSKVVLGQGSGGTRMPPFTFCMLPGYKNTDINIMSQLNFSTYCSGEEERKEFKKCIDNARLDQPLQV